MRTLIASLVAFGAGMAIIFLAGAIDVDHRIVLLVAAPVPAAVCMVLTDFPRSAGRRVGRSGSR